MARLNFSFSVPEEASRRLQVSHSNELSSRVEMRHRADAVFYVSIYTRLYVYVLLSYSLTAHVGLALFCVRVCVFWRFRVYMYIYIHILYVRTYVGYISTCMYICIIYMPA